MLDMGVPLCYTETMMIDSNTKETTMKTQRTDRLTVVKLWVAVAMGSLGLILVTLAR